MIFKKGGETNKCHNRLILELLVYFFDWDVLIDLFRTYLAGRRPSPCLGWRQDGVDDCTAPGLVNNRLPASDALETLTVGGIF